MDDYKQRLRRLAIRDDLLLQAITVQDSGSRAGARAKWKP
jgi:hypothetical protein